MDQNISLVYRAKSCVERLKNRLSLISQHGMIHSVTITIDVNAARTKYVANIFSDSFYSRVCSKIRFRVHLENDYTPIAQLVGRNTQKIFCFLM